MAIIKSIENPSTGVVASYWKINTVKAQFGPDAKCELGVAAYVSAKARDQQKEPAFGLSVELDKSILPKQLDHTSLYEALKKVEAFAGATDDMISYSQKQLDDAKSARDLADATAAANLEAYNAGEKERKNADAKIDEERLAAETAAAQAAAKAAEPKA